VSESVALSSLANQVAVLSSKIVLERGPVPWLIVGGCEDDPELPESCVMTTLPGPSLPPAVLF